MAKLVFEMNQSLDGYVEHDALPSNPLFRHWIERTKSVSGSVYGRRMYEIMRYWDEDHCEWDADRHEFAAAWRKLPKWVASRSLTSVGPNATLVDGDIESAVNRLKAAHEGELTVAGPELAGSLSNAGLIDEYRLYIHPFVTGGSKTFFAGARLALRLVASDRLEGDVVRLVYAPA